MSEFTILAVIRQLLDKLSVDAVERILAYMETYLEQRINFDMDIDEQEG